MGRRLTRTEAGEVRGSVLRLGETELLVLSGPAGQGEWGKLTPAERRVAELAVQGRSNAEIAAERGRSVRTVANQLASAFRKLGVGSRVGLAACLMASVLPDDDCEET